MLYLTLEIEIPDWAEWLAMDKDGTMYFYDTLPEISKDQWIPSPSSERFQRIIEESTAVAVLLVARESKISLDGKFPVADSVWKNAIIRVR
jgi:hypothetical protein